MKNQKTAVRYGIGAVVLWSTVASAFKLTLNRISPLTMLLLASSFSTAVLFLILLTKRKGVGKVDAKSLFTAAISGFLNPFLYYMVLFKAYALLPAQEAMALNYIWPVTLVLLSVPLLGHSIGVGQLLSITLSFTGVLVIASGGNPLAFSFSNTSGVILALASSVIWSFYWIVNARDSRDEVEKLFFGFLFGTIYTACFALFKGIDLPDPKAIMGSVYIGLFEMGVTFVLWLKALKWAENSAMIGNLVFVTPFASLLLIAVLVGESVKISTIAGLIFIIFGIVLQKVFSGKKDSAES